MLFPNNNMIKIAIIIREKYVEAISNIYFSWVDKKSWLN